MNLNFEDSKVAEDIDDLKKNVIEYMLIAQIKETYRNSMIHNIEVSLKNVFIQKDSI